ncbi:PorV/PorQ family protein [bacterium]|nr:PorV/PorQ family protein [bacterium]
MTSSSRLIALLLTLSLLTPVLADNSGASFLLLPGDVRAAAMGSTGVGEDGVLSALHFNPAGLGSRLDPVMSASYNSWLGDAGYGYLAGCLPINDLVIFSLGFTYPTMGGFERRIDDSQNPEGTFGAMSLAGEVGYSREIIDGLTAGLTAGVVYQKLDEYSATGVAFDLGVQYRPLNWLGVGVAGRNFGTPLTFIKEETALPSTIVGGVNLRFLESDLNINLDAEYHLDDAEDTIFGHFGAEYVLFNTAALRLGYTYGFNDHGGKLDGLSAGLGLTIVGITLDFAYSGHGDLGNSYRAALGYDFAFVTEHGQNLNDYLAQLEERILTTSRAFYEEGQDYQARENYAEAASAFDKALIWNPDFPEAAAAYDSAVMFQREQEIDEHLQQGELYLRVEDYVAARAEFAAVLEIEPEHALAAEKLQFAVNALAELLAEREAQVALLSEEAAAAFAAENYIASIIGWGEVLAIDPTNALAQGYLNQSEERLAELVATEKRVAASLEGQGRYSEALDHYLTAQELAPDDLELPGSISRVRGYLSKQIDELVNDGIARYDRKDYTSAEDYLRQALRLDPDNRSARDYLNRIASATAASSSSGPAEDPVVANEFYLKGIQSYTRKDYEQAIYYWQQCLKYQPGHPKAGPNIERAQAMIAALSSS